MSLSKCNVIACSIGAASATLFSGCGPADAPKPPQAEPTLEVQTVRPHRGEVYRYINLPGEVHPLLQATLFAKVDGYLQTLTVDKGDAVKTGDLIADIEVPELKANRVKYQAEVQLAEAEYQELRESPTNHPTPLSAAELQAAKNRMAVVQGRLAMAKAHLEYTEIMLNYARVTAPFDGIITKRFVDPGAYIPVPNAAATPEAAAIVTVTDFKTLRLQVAVPEIEVPHIKLGQPIRWTTDGLPGQYFDGTVTRAYWALDRATKTMLTEAQMTNHEMALRPGMLVNARIGLEKKEDALLVPVAALVKQKANAFVFTIVEGKTKKMSVQTGFNDGTHVEIASGLALEDLVILAGQQVLRDAQPVRSLNAK